MTGALSLQVLLTGIQTGGPALAADTVDLLAVAAYLEGARRLQRRGRRWSPVSTVCFAAGIACLWVAVGSGLAAYDERPVVHVVQHALLMMVAPPLLVMGRPVTLAAQASRRSLQVRIVKLANSRMLRWATFPALGWPLYYGSMCLMLLDRGVYGYLLGHPLAHEAGHLLLLVVGYLYWQPLLDADPSPWRLSARVRLGSAVLGAGVDCALGLLVIAGAGVFTAEAVPAGTVFLLLALPACSACCPFMIRRRRAQGLMRRPAASG